MRVSLFQSLSNMSDKREELFLIKSLMVHPAGFDLLKSYFSFEYPLIHLPDPFSSIEVRQSELVPPNKGVFLDKDDEILGIFNFPSTPKQDEGSQSE